MEKFNWEEVVWGKVRRTEYSLHLFASLGTE